MTTASNISGVAAVRKNIWRASTFSAGDCDEEGPRPCMRSPDRLNRDDEHGGAHSAKPKAKGRPDEQRNGRRCPRRPANYPALPATDRRLRLRPLGCLPQGNRLPGLSPGCNPCPFRGEIVDAKKDRRDQHNRGDRIRHSEHSAIRPSSEFQSDRRTVQGGSPQAYPKRNDDHRNQNKNDRFTKRDEMER